MKVYPMIVITNSYNSHCRQLYCDCTRRRKADKKANEIKHHGWDLVVPSWTEANIIFPATETLHCTTRDGAGGKIYLKPKLPPKNFAKRHKDHSTSRSLGTIEILEMGCRDWIGNSKRPH